MNRLLKGINVNKYSGPDGTDVRTLKFCADQFSGVLLHLFHTVCTFPLEKVNYYPSHEKVCPKQLNDLRPVAWLTSLEKDRWKRLWSHSFSLLFTPCLVHCSLHTGQEEALKMSSCDFWIRCISTWSCRTLMPRLLCADFSSAFNAMQPRVLAQNLIYSSAWPGLVECRFF